MGLTIRSFAGGEVAPALACRDDLAKIQIALKQCKNIQIERHGGVANRAGFRFVEQCKGTFSTVKRLHKYIAQTPKDSVLIEHGPSYLRFVKAGARVEVEDSTVTAWSNATAYVPGDLASRLGVVYYCILAHTNQQPPNATYWYPLPTAGGGFSIYEIPVAFTDPAGTRFRQNGQIITLTHASVIPYDLVFVSLTRWVISAVVTSPDVSTPTGLAVATVAGAENWAYKITAIHAVTFEESDPTAEVRDPSATAPTVAAPHLLTWNAVSGAGSYRIYCDRSGNGTFGYIGTATGQVNFQNPGITEDMDITPPASRASVFSGSGDRPRICAYHQQRRFFANTDNVPDGIWGSRIGFPDNFGLSEPLQEDDSLTMKIAGNNHHPVRDMVAVRDLLLMTDGGEWRLSAGPNIPITPTTIATDQETYVGISADVPALVVGNSVLYLQSRQSIIRELRFDQVVEGMNGRDLTVFATHLFDGYEIVAMDYALNPHSIVWCVRDDGRLLGLTYVHEQEIWGWHWHETNHRYADSSSFGSIGRFLDVCVVPEDGIDAVYVLVRRVISDGLGGDLDLVYIERLENRQTVDLAVAAASTTGFNDAVFFLDSGLSYSGAPVSSVSGLQHLEGQTVSVVADGNYILDAVVTSGAVALGASYSRVHVGLFINQRMVTLDVAAGLRDKMKTVKSVVLEVESHAFLFNLGTLGTSASVTNTWQVLRRTSDQTLNFGPQLFTGPLELPIRPTVSLRETQIVLEAALGMPFRVHAVTPVFEAAA